MTIVRRDIISQKKSKRFFIDKEVVDKCYDKISQVWWKTHLDMCLGRHCCSDLNYSEIKEFTDPALTIQQKILRFISMGGIYGYHMMYVAMKADDTVLTGRADALTLLETTGNTNIIVYKSVLYC